jgi:hypothetical protein
VSDVRAAGDALSGLAESSKRLAELAAEPEARWRARPDGSGWSAHEALAHLRASDEIQAPRLLQILVRDEPFLPGWDAGRWQEVAGYDGWPAADVVEAFLHRRRELLRALAALPAESWRRTGLHEERGALTLLAIAEGIAGHEREHLDQIEAALRAAG